MNHHEQTDCKTGFFLTLEGGEGVGKSTAIETIERYLVEQGRDYLITREPGGTPIMRSAQPRACMR